MILTTLATGWLALTGGARDTKTGVEVARQGKLVPQVPYYKPNLPGKIQQQQQTLPEFSVDSALGIGPSKSWNMPSDHMDHTSTVPSTQGNIAARHGYQSDPTIKERDSDVEVPVSNAQILEKLQAAILSKSQQHGNPNNLKSPTWLAMYYSEMNSGIDKLNQRIRLLGDDLEKEKEIGIWLHVESELHEEAIEWSEQHDHMYAAEIEELHFGDFHETVLEKTVRMLVATGLYTEEELTRPFPVPETTELDHAIANERRALNTDDIYTIECTSGDQCLQTIRFLLDGVRNLKRNQGDLSVQEYMLYDDMGRNLRAMVTNRWDRMASLQKYVPNSFQKFWSQTLQSLVNNFRPRMNEKVRDLLRTVKEGIACFRCGNNLGQD